jgi:mannonate dehydratase
MNENKYWLEQTMRWYGPNDSVSLRDILQAGCSGVVSALHHIPVGEVWQDDEIKNYKQKINNAGLSWTVVESLPVHEDIKRGDESRSTLIKNYKNSLIHLAANGIKVITYNFMPILDWIRTDVDYLLPNGAKALYFRKADYAVFDLFMLKRENAIRDFTHDEYKRYQNHFDNMSEEEKKRIYNNVLLGLPGSDIPFTIEEVHLLLKKYKDIDRNKLKENLIYFLKEITPLCDELGLQLAIHPDDPPYSVLGLPRIMSTFEDAKFILEQVPNQSNGFCFCTGSFGARPDNDIPTMIDTLADRIYFLHLRNTKRDNEGNFFEDNHLDGDTNMYEVMKRIVAIMNTHKRTIPMRPDHGHKMLDDLLKKTYPGYSAIGRLKGLAELRGLEYGLQMG